MTDHPTSPPAGWYADPGGSGGLRWWDGNAWTPHTHADPSAPSSGSAAPGSTAPRSASPEPTSRPAATPPGTTPGSAPAEDVPWWAQSNDGTTPSWWAADPGYAVPGATPESQGVPTAGPYGYPRSSAPMGRAEGTVRALVLGIASLICCGIILGPIAIYEGSQVRYRVRASNGRLDGDGFGIAAMVLGGIATVLSVVGIYLAATGHSPFVVGTGR